LSHLFFKLLEGSETINSTPADSFCWCIL